MKLTYTQQFTYRDLPDDFRDRYPESVVSVPYGEVADPQKMRQFFRNGLDEMMHAARAGFDAVAVTEHGHASYDVSPNPDLTAAVLAYTTETEGLDVGVHVIGRTLGKTREPLRVAEEYAVLDQISGGRLLAGFPVGLAYDANFNYGGAPIETRARYDENLRLVLRAWTSSEPFPWNGKYAQHPAVNIWPRPLQTPHPPISITTVGTPNTIKSALERDFGFNLIAFFGDPMVIAKPIYDYFWHTASEMGVDDNPYRAAYAQFVAVADTDEEAERLYAEHIEYSFAKGIGYVPPYRLAMPGGIPPDGLRHLLATLPPPSPAPPTYRELVASGAVVAGSAATVRERLEAIIKTFRIGNLSVFMQLGSMPHELTKHSIDQFAAGVMPHLRPTWSEYDHVNRWWPARLGGQPPSPQQTSMLAAAAAGTRR